MPVGNMYEFDNQIFSSQEKLAKYAKVSLVNLGKALRELDYNAEKAVAKVREERIKEERENPDKFKYKYKNKLFKSISEVCLYYDFAPSDFKHEYYSNGKKLDDAIEKCLNNKNKKEVDVESSTIPSEFQIPKNPRTVNLGDIPNHSRASTVLKEQAETIKELNRMLNNIQDQLHTMGLILNYFSFELLKKEL